MHDSLWHQGTNDLECIADKANDEGFSVACDHRSLGPATLYVLTGSGFDPATQTVTDAYLRYVVYIPGPWIMFPGTPGAHIMINPPQE
ncbi:MAG: hypothetical protein AAGA48_00780 [Myxococcota bacterium]